MEQRAERGKKKLCIVMGGHFSATIGGAQFQAKCIVDECVKRGEYDIYYLARNINERFTPYGYKIVKIESTNRLSRHTFLFDSGPLTKLLTSINPDIIYQRGLKAHTAIGARYAKKHNAKFFFHIAHDYDVSPSMYFASSWKALIYLIEKKVASYGIRHATGIIAQTKQQARLLKLNYGKSAALIFPNIVPRPEEKIQKSKGKIKVLWVANFKAVKQPEIFIKLAGDFEDRTDIEFVMIGRSGNGNAYRELHDKIKNIKNLNYLGELPIERVNEHLASSHIFVNTSKAEGYPNTFLQAWVRKVPILSLHADIDDILKKGNYGVLCEEYPVLVKSLAKLADNKNLREKLGGEGRTFALSNNSNKNISKLFDLFVSESPAVN